MGPIAIQVGDLLISGSDTFLEYITFRMKGEFEVDTFEENKATYIGMEIEKIDTPDFKGVILDSNNYEDKINHIEIPQARSKQKDDFLIDEEQSAAMSELGKLMWIARIARHGAIHDAS